MTEPTDMVSQFASWQAFYAEVFSLQVQSSCALGTAENGHERLLVGGEGLTLDQAIQASQNLFPVSSVYNTSDRDLFIHFNERDTRTTYGVLVRESVEVGPEFYEKSADDLARDQIRGITLLERILYGLKYFRETGRHLDTVGGTLCFGSRDSQGNVPRVHLSSSLGVQIARSQPDERNRKILGRRVLPFFAN
jgi:hypothetical protein